MRPHTCGTTTGPSTTGSGVARAPVVLCLEEHRPGLGRDDGDEADMTPRRYFSQIISSVRLMSWTP